MNANNYLVDASLRRGNCNLLRRWLIRLGPNAAMLLGRLHPHNDDVHGAIEQSLFCSLPPRMLKMETASISNIGNRSLLLFEGCRATVLGLSLLASASSMIAE